MQCTEKVDGIITHPDDNSINDLKKVINIKTIFPVPRLIRGIFLSVKNRGEYFLYHILRV